MWKGPIRRGEPEAAAATTPSSAPTSSERVGDYEVSSSRARLLDVVPIAWLDLLIGAVADLPLAGGEAAVVEAMVEALAVILPTYAVGACFVPDAATPGGPKMIKRMPEGMVE